MSDEINLLKSKQKDPESKISNVLILRTIAMSILFGVSFVSIALFIYIALSPLPKLQEREKSELKIFQAFQSKVAKILFTKERVTGIATILQTRSASADTLLDTASLINGNMELDGIKVESNKITLTLTSNSLKEHDQFMQRLVEANESKKTFQRITLLNLYLSKETGLYVLIVEMEK